MIDSRVQILDSALFASVWAKLHSRVQVFVLPHLVDQLPDDAGVQDEVVKEQAVT